MAPTKPISEDAARRLKAARPRLSRIVVFGNEAITASIDDPEITLVSSRSVLSSLIAEHWTGRTPALAIVGPLSFDAACAIDDALGTDLIRGVPETRRRAMKVRTPDGWVELVSGAGAIVREARAPRPDLIVPSTVAGMGVIGIGPGAFADTDVVDVSFGAPLRRIGEEAFARCSSLQRLCLPGTLDVIGEATFSMCVSLETLELPSGLRTIGARAFEGCTALTAVDIPSSVLTIGDDAFAGCAPSLRVRVEEGSAAQSWARARGIPHDVTGARDVPRSSPFRCRVVFEAGVEYETMPGGGLEVRSIQVSPDIDTVEIPESVDGIPVRGLGYGALADTRVPHALQLPKSLQWIAPHAVVPGAALATVSGGRRVQARGRHALPAGCDVTIRATIDADSARLTLRMVCQRIGVDVPAAFAADADEPFTGLAAGVLSSTAGNLYFGSFDGDGAEVDRLLRRGIRMFVSDSEVRASDGSIVAHILHPSPQRAFESLCAGIAEQYSAKTIAVTGSVGKTSTKEMLRRVSETSRSTLYSTGNQNGVAQVGRYIQKLTTKTQVYIQETGAARPGAVESGARMLHPDAFVITNIGVNHIGDYGGSQERILEDKASHDRYLPDGGVAFLNVDDPKLRTLALTHRIIKYGIDSADADYYAEDVVEKDGRLTFTIVEAETGVRTAAIVHAFGRHNVGNAVVAFAVGRWLDIPTAKIVKGIGEYRGEGLRQNLAEVGGRRVLVDCYNASEIAMVSIADALQRISVRGNGRRILVFADIDDKLGDITEEVHRRVGRRLAEESGIDLFVCFGEHAAWTAEELGVHGRDVFATTDREELHRYLAAELTEDDLPAFKGGQQMALSITIDALYGSSFVLADGDVLLRRGTEIAADGVRYRDIREFGVEVRGAVDRGHTSLSLPGEITGSPVLLIGRSAFSRSALTDVELSAPLRTLAPSAFYLSAALERVSLPPTLRVIGRSAFNGCGALREVDLPEGLTTIEARAFYGCKTLERIFIPSSVRTIEEQVFSYSRSVVIECEAGSYADAFCREHWRSRTIRNV